MRYNSIKKSILQGNYEYISDTDNTYNTENTYDTDNTENTDDSENA